MKGIRDETGNLCNDEHLMGIVDGGEDGRSTTLQEAYSCRRSGHE